MRILIGMWHPAHVHFFKNFYWEMKRRGHDVIVAAREKESVYSLLKAYEIPFHHISSHKLRFIEKGVDAIYRWIRTFGLVRDLNPDVMMGIGDFFFAQIGKIVGIPSLIFTDSEYVAIDQFFTYPFAMTIFTPACFLKNLGSKQLRYDSYHEVAYLHPNYFTPDRSIYGLLGLEDGEEFIIMRFVSWKASHDIGHHGLSISEIRSLVERLSSHYKIFISSESELPLSLADYRIRIPPSRIHDALNFAQLFIGEGATMASECAVLGTPAVYINPLRAGTIAEQEERYGAVNQVLGLDQIMSVSEKILHEMEGKAGNGVTNRIIEEKIDVTRMMVEYVEAM